MFHGRIVKRAVLEICDLAQNRAHEDERGAGQFLFAHFLANVTQRAAKEHLIGPSYAIAHDHRAVGTVIGRQFPLNGAQVAYAKVDGQRGTRAREIFQRLSGRHGGGFHRHPRQHDRLANLRDGQFLSQFSGHGRIGRHTRDNLVVDPVRAQPPDLFGDGTIKRWIARMHPRHILTTPMRRDDLCMGLIECHWRRVHDPRARRCAADNLFRHKRACIKADRAVPDHPLGFFGQKLRISRACAYEIDCHCACPPGFVCPKKLTFGWSARSPSILRA